MSLSQALNTPINQWLDHDAGDGTKAHLIASVYGHTILNGALHEITYRTFCGTHPTLQLKPTLQAWPVASYEKCAACVVLSVFPINGPDERGYPVPNPWRQLRGMIESEDDVFCTILDDAITLNHESYGAEGDLLVAVRVKNEKWAATPWRIALVPRESLRASRLGRYKSPPVSELLLVPVERRAAGRLQR